LREHTSLKAFWYVAKNWKRVVEKRRLIMSRRRASDDYIASWFSYRPVSQPVRTMPKTPAKVLSRSRAAQS
jgi:hypothetical protein